MTDFNQDFLRAKANLYNKQLAEIEEARQDMMDDLRKQLPPPNSMVSNAINMCLDRIRKGEDVAHYKEVLKKLNKIDTNK